MSKYTSFLLGSYLLLSSTSLVASAQDLVLLKRVREYWKEGDYSLAKKQIRDYLEQTPEGEIQQELHLLLGDLYLREGNPETALEEYNRIEKDSLKEKCFYNKALCLYETKNLDLLASHLEEMHKIPQLSSKECHSLLCLHAAILLETGKEENLIKAQILLESCKGKEVSSTSLALLAQIFLLREEQDKAAECYLQLGEEDASQAPKLWAKAALLLADKDPKKALSLLEKTLSLPGAQESSVLVYNLLVLQYRLGLFNELVHSYETRKQQLTPEHSLPALHLVGKSLYHLGEFDKASAPLLAFAQKGTLAPEVRKEVYLQLLSSSYQTQNLALYEEVLAEALPLLGQDPLACKVEYSHIELLRVQGEREKLISATEQFLHKYPDHPKKASLSRHLSYAFYEAKEWNKAEEAILSSLSLTSEEKMISHLRRLRLNCAVQMMQNAEAENQIQQRAHLIEVQQEALATPSLLSFQERSELLPHLARNLFLAERYKEALQTISLFAAEHPHKNLPFDLLLTQALCYLKDPESTHLFVIQAEKLLQDYPDSEEFSILRTHLFNTYVQLAKRASAASRSECLQKAGDLLYSAFIEKKQILQPQNIHWLAEHYYQLATPQDLVATKRSIELFLELLESKEDIKEIALYRLSDLLSYTGELDKKASLLEHWTQKAPKSRIQKHLLLELASTYDALGEQDKALALYDTLSHSTATSHIDLQALIQKSRIIFSRLSKEEQTEENPLCLEILNHLKDVENERNLASEPLHLEAGLTYIDCKIALVEYRDRAKEKKKELLSQLLDNINLYTLDPLSSQSFLIETYKTYILSEIALCEPDEQIKNTALVSLKQLQNDPSTPKSLQSRIKQRGLL